MVKTDHIVRQEMYLGEEYEEDMNEISAGNIGSSR
jgi:hypothetical protein